MHSCKVLQIKINIWLQSEVDRKINYMIKYWLYTVYSVFSSPGLKAQMSFSDHLSVCPSVCKLFTFSSSCPEPLGHFQSNLAQSIRFNFFYMKVQPSPSQMGDDYKIEKMHWQNLLLQNFWSNSTQTWHKAYWSKGD